MHVWHQGLGFVSSSNLEILIELDLTHQQVSSTDSVISNNFMTENGQATLFDSVKNTAEVSVIVQTVGGYKLQRVSE